MTLCPYWSENLPDISSNLEPIAKGRFVVLRGTLFGIGVRENVGIKCFTKLTF